MRDWTWADTLLWCIGAVIVTIGFFYPIMASFMLAIIYLLNLLASTLNEDDDDGE